MLAGARTYWWLGAATTGRTSRVSGWALDVWHEPAKPGACSLEDGVKEIEERDCSETAKKASKESGQSQSLEESQQSDSSGEVVATSCNQVPGFSALFWAEVWQECGRMGVG